MPSMPFMPFLPRYDGSMLKPLTALVLVLVSCCYHGRGYAG